MHLWPFNRPERTEHQRVPEKAHPAAKRVDHRLRGLLPQLVLSVRGLPVPADTHPEAAPRAPAASQEEHGHVEVYNLDQAQAARPHRHIQQEERDWVRRLDEARLRQGHTGGDTGVEVLRPGGDRQEDY